MIQELLGGGSSLLGGSERKISFNGAILEGSPCPPPPTATTTTINTPPPDQQNLRCPRCDSSNTKFCYYNNYNLTQPRHFCKTCRRYWTKGGALRNVPIGGGCRKNKTTTTPTTAAKSSTSGKIKPVTDISKPSFGFDHDPSSNPILWASPQNSQLLALLRASHNPNPNPNPSSGMIKEEGTMIGSHMTSSDLAIGSGALNARPLSLDPLSQVPLGLCSSFWKTNQHQQQQQPPQHHHQNQNHNQNQHNHQTQQHGLLMGDAQNSGIQELYQRLRSSVSYYSDHSPAVMSNAVSSSLTSTSIMEPSPISTSELGYWNPTLSWSNLPATHGAFP